ncbi:HAD-IC family P-type ATPase [Methanocorpusculum vombati]|uniref:HAD-IC family P-type ATPase n=1 Tax=Methanocorpusculum vombati TaxID=3002864 RepID=A0ABT4INJ6_9EURY|nr:HAD-IC family P-type ATPase [Methanocorpusculum vombati]MCZ9318961.1 HAD-IC family P-type ATPase [Methanocorpusculum sp.]MCZ0863330.1 HAD-IC family P-type ATPase [Methanocorpusculum vombati]MDE2520817.1 HAD-IC family P-type ATPase [Methanocorpusculum sp.]MDE2533812.1 HAD-IC family P-type ATPase [Methanocorpusculum sp.]MDE2545308.1 HAD-IC family P-type ATPase [Methanocorpusculum sp.]
MTVAAVFDSAGTLLRTYRSVLSVADHRMADASMETTTLTFQDPDRILVLLNLHSRDIMDSNPDALLSEYLTEANVSFGISCGRRVIVSDVVGDILYHDTDAKISDMQEVIRDCWMTVSRQSDSFALNAGAIINLRTRKIEFAIAAAGYPFPGVREMVSLLHSLGVAVFIASGDRTEKLEIIADQIGIPRNRVHGVATPVTKAQIVQNLKTEYDVVVMTGDGINDLSAMKSADVAILTVQQEGTRPEILFDTADYVIENICEAARIIRGLLPGPDT